MIEASIENGLTASLAKAIIMREGSLRDLAIDIKTNAIRFIN